MNKFEHLICRVRHNLIVGGYKLKETISSKRVDTVVLGQEKILLLLKRDYYFLLRLKGNVMNFNERNGNKLLEKLNALLQMLVSKVVSLQRHNRTHFRILNVKLKTPV